MTPTDEEEEEDNDSPPKSGVHENFFAIERAADGTPNAQGLRRSRNGQRTGIWTFFYRSGKKRSEGGYDGNDHHGTFTLFYETGAIKEVGAYHHGHAHGRFQRWSESGVLMKDVVFNHGVKVVQIFPAMIAHEASQ